MRFISNSADYYHMLKTDPLPKSSPEGQTPHIAYFTLRLNFLKEVIVSQIHSRFFQRQQH
jgi:hypothetical protein